MPPNSRGFNGDQGVAGVKWCLNSTEEDFTRRVDSHG